MLEGIEQTPTPAASIVPADVFAAALAESAPAATTSAGSLSASAAATSSAATIEAFDYDAEAHDVIEFAFAITSPLYPSLADVYTPGVRDRIASAAAPLMRKYGANLGALGPELGFAIVILPLVAPTAQAIQRDRQQAKAQRQARTIEAPADAGSATADRFPTIDADRKPDDERPAESDLGRFGLA